MANVCLIYPPISFKKESNINLDFSGPPIGLLYIASLLEKNGISVQILDIHDGRMNIDDIIKFLYKHRPSVVGISALTPTIRTGVEIAKAIKDSFGDEITICLGNCHISADPTVISRYPYFDIGIIGEGELTFLDITKRILGGEKVKGLFQGEIVKNLDDLPFPAYHLIDINRYLKYGMPAIQIIMTRGCPYNCIFCSRSGLSRKVRNRSATNVVDEMEKHFDICNGNFFFNDDTFSLKRDAVISLCDEIQRRKIKPKWKAITRFDRLDEKMVAKMSEAGCETLLCGVESGNERIRNEIVQKNLTDKSIYEGAKLCDKYGIHIELFFMLGFPSETKKELHDTITFPRKLKKMGIKNIDIIGINPTILLPGSILWNKAVEEGFCDNDIVDKYISGKLGDGFREIFPYYIPKGLSWKDITDARRKGLLSFYLNPRYIINRTIKDISSYKALKMDVVQGFNLIMYGRSKTKG